MQSNIGRRYRNRRMKHRRDANAYDNRSPEKTIAGTAVRAVPARLPAIRDQ